MSKIEQLIDQLMKDNGWSEEWKIYKQGRKDEKTKMESEVC